MFNLNSNDKYENARNALKIAIILSIANILLGYMGAGFGFPFSLSSPTMALFWGNYAALLLGTSFQFSLTLGLLFAGVVLGIFGGCYYFSKKRPLFLLMALFLVIIDSIWLGWILKAFEPDFWTLIDIIFRAWLLMLIYAGIKDSRPLKLSKSPKAKNSAAIKTNAKPENALISYDYKNLKIIINQADELIQLVVNNKVYDEKESDFKTSFALEADVKNHYIRYVFDITSREHRIFIDNELLITEVK